DAITYHANGANLDGLLDGATYFVVNDQPGGINPVSFTGSAVAGGGSAITIPHHGLYTGEPVTYSVAPGGTAIGGLTSGTTTTYYVVVLDANTTQLATSLTTLAGSVLTLSLKVASGTQTLTDTSNGTTASFTPSPVVDSTAKTITVPGHG